jgi:hypothetical protein
MLIDTDTKTIQPTAIPSQRFSLSDIYSVTAFKEKYSHLFRSKSELDYLLRNRKLNGLEASGAVIVSQSGRRLSIVEPLFSDWFLVGVSNEL